VASITTEIQFTCCTWSHYR